MMADLELFSLCGDLQKKLFISWLIWLIYLKSQQTWLISQVLADLISLLQFFDIHKG